MINSLHLENFRKHENMEWTFSSGLLVVRGNSEAGKSTLIEAIAYALFGARACREALERVVTYGKSLNQLKVTLDFTMDGVPYRLVRSKSGAELTTEGVRVTGQTEVTAFIERLLGAPAALAQSLWLVNQGTIRGALEQGPKETARLIEQLADFELIDRLLNLIQENLPCGSPKLAEDRIKQAEDVLSLVQSKPLIQPSPEGVDAATEVLAKAKVQYEASAAAHVEFVQKSYKPGTERLKACAELGQKVEYTKTALKEASRLHGAIGERPVFVPEALTLAEQEMTILRKAQEGEGALLRAWSAFQSIPATYDNEWEGTQEAFDTYFRDQTNTLKPLRAPMTEMQTQLRLLQAQERMSGTCGACGKDVSEIPEVLEKVARNTKETQALKEDIAVLSTDIKALEIELLVLNQILGKSVPVRELIAKHHDLIELVDSHVPARAFWKGGDISARPDISAEISRLQKIIINHLSMRKAQESHDVESKVKADAVERLSQECAQTVAEHTAAKIETQGLDTLEKTKEESAQLVQEVRRAADEASSDLMLEKLGYSSAVARFKAMEEAITAAGSTLASARREAAELSFNNTLLKKVKAARPLIVDRLWGVVLGAISTYFSKIRGVHSSVTRDVDGFKVDGAAVEGLSGSTLDVLGLSIRMALLHTFLPRVQFIVLDEPAAACDDSREAALIGTVATAQFEQILLVTHSDLADTYANQLITL